MDESRLIEIKEDILVDNSNAAQHFRENWLTRERFSWM